MRGSAPWKRLAEASARHDDHSEPDAQALLGFIALVALCAFVVPAVLPTGVAWFKSYAGAALGFHWPGVVFASPLVGIGVMFAGAMRSEWSRCLPAISLGGFSCWVVLRDPELAAQLTKLRPPGQHLPWLIQVKEFLLLCSLSLCIGLSGSAAWPRFGLGATSITAVVLLLFASEANTPSLIQSYAQLWSNVADRRAIDPELLRMLPDLPRGTSDAIVAGWGLHVVGKGLQFCGLALMNLGLLMGCLVALRSTLSKGRHDPVLIWIGTWIFGSMLSWSGEFFWLAPHSQSLWRDGLAVASITLDHGAALGALALLPMGLCWFVSATRSGLAERARLRLVHRGQFDDARLDSLLERIHREGGEHLLSPADKRFLARMSQRDRKV